MQTSAKQVDQSTLDQIENQFYKALSSLKSDRELKAFLHAFLSETEATVMCKRFAILKMLSEGKSYTAIEDALKVSSATVSSISKLSQEPAIAALLKELEADEWATAMTAKFTERFSFLKKKESKTEETISPPADTSILAAASDSESVIETSEPNTNESTQTV